MVAQTQIPTPTGENSGLLSTLWKSRSNQQLRGQHNGGQAGGQTVGQTVGQTSFLRQVIEGLQDGVLILTVTGEIVYGNTKGYQISDRIRELEHDSSNSQRKPNPQTVPAAIWSLCQMAILPKGETVTNENQRGLTTKPAVICGEIPGENLETFRLRIRFLNLQELNFPVLLVTIENRRESMEHAVLMEIKKYNLTPRESEIWSLYRNHQSYKQIAEQLYITVNTVKKHMKNIHGKIGE